MPTTRRVRRKPRRATRRRRKPMTRKVIAIPQANLGGMRRLVAGIPKTRKVTLRYVESIQLDPGVGPVPATYTFRGNNTFDPDFTGGGHQPLGRDEWMQLYNHITVIGSKISVSFATTGNIPALCAVQKSAATTTTNVMTEALEQPYTSFGICGGYQGGKSPLTLTNSGSVKKFLGISHPMSAADNLRESIGGNPTDPEYFYYILYVNPLDTSDLPPVNALVVVDYTCILSEPKFLNQS